MTVSESWNALSARQDFSGVAGMDLSQIPAAQPPEGVTPNFVNPPSLATLYRVIIYVFMPLMSALVLVRLGTRLRQMHKLVADDIFCILGAAAIIGYCVVVLLAADNPLGRHFWDVPLSMITEEYLRLTTLALIMHSLGSMFFKLTLMTLILRLFHPNVWARRLLWGGIAATTIVYTALTIFVLSSCVPTNGQTWQYKMYNGTCIMAQERNSMTNGVFGLISDLYILVIPLWLLSSLSLPTKRKLGVMGVFLTGLLAVGCSLGGVIVRATWDLADATWSIAYVFGILELNIGLICACMPVVALPFKTVGASIAASWNSFRDFSRTRLLNRSSNSKLAEIDEYNMTDSPTEKSKEHELPQVPDRDGAITGLRTFMRGAFRSTAAPETQVAAPPMPAPPMPPMPPMPANDQIQATTYITADYSPDYHDQIKNMHYVDISGGTDHSWSQPGSHPMPQSGSYPMPQPPAQAAQQQEVYWTQNQQTYHYGTSPGGHP